MTKKLYGHTRVRDYDSYGDHVLAMTAEGLHSKAEIACELAWRDDEINILKAERDIMRSAFNDAITYAIDKADDAKLFLTVWNEGDFGTLRIEYPDFKFK